jgi:hypothetical protein
MTQATANFDFGQNSLGIRDVRMVTLSVKQCILKSLPEWVALLVLAHVPLPSQQAQTTPPAAATNVPPQAALPMAAADVSQPSPTLPIVANTPLQPALGTAAFSTLNLLCLPVFLLKQMPPIYLFKQICLL